MGLPQLKIVWDRDRWVDECDERGAIQFACTRWWADTSIWQDLEEEAWAAAVSGLFYVIAGGQAMKPEKRQQKPKRKKPLISKKQAEGIARTIKNKSGAFAAECMRGDDRFTEAADNQASYRNSRGA